MASYPRVFPISAAADAAQNRRIKDLYLLVNKIGQPSADINSSEKAGRKNSSEQKVSNSEEPEYSRAPNDTKEPTAKKVLSG